MELSPTALTLIGLLLAAWTGGAAWLMIRAGGRAEGADSMRRAVRRLTRMLDDAPAIPMLVRTDGRIEAPERLARWFGLTRLPEYLSQLSEGTPPALDEEQVRMLVAAVRRTQKTAAPLQLALRLPDGERTLALRGALADPEVSPGGAALLWVFDISDSERELVGLRRDISRSRSDFNALTGLIEAAPMPMWFRTPDSKLRLVNKAYVEAVGAESAETVIEQQIELVEPAGGRTAGQIALEAAERAEPIDRVVTTTIDGERRSLRVTDLALTDGGIAGYAVDIEEMEQQARQFRAFREAQRSILDQLSIGVAQFDRRRRLTFANQPFHRVFGIPPGQLNDELSFEQVLMAARENGRTPEVRDFPAWRSELVRWFLRGDAHEEAWPLSDGTHLRILAQPMPDGGLVLIAEDRTEQLALSATRDTLLRTRTATFDQLYEALAVFAPDGHLELWNRSFPGAWGIEPEVLEGHPSASDLLAAIGPKLANPKGATQLGAVIRTATLDRKKRDGRVDLADGRTLEYAGVPLPDGNGLLTVLDITAAREAQEALLERNRALEEADAVMTKFLANMSYEFRTPLTSIGGFAELLEAEVAGPMSDDAREYVRAISQSVRRLTEQVENVLELTQSEAGLLPMTRQRVEMLGFLTELVRSRENDILAAGLSLDLRGDPGLHLEIDPHQMRRALSHILDNAIAATPPKGRILLELKQRDNQVRIVVTDNGRGMAADELARALDGLRPSSDGKGLERRQGLGLPLARRLIEGHGGSVEIVSRRATGTVVTVRLPL